MDNTQKPQNIINPITKKEIIQDIVRLLVKLQKEDKTPASVIQQRVEDIFKKI